jgi:hypothetical protein
MKDFIDNNITMNADQTEMLRIGPDGFWVRGVKVEQDEHEAEQVYQAFQEWLVWANLTKDY